MTDRPSFWNEETHGVDDYWFYRASAFVYPAMGITMASYGLYKILNGETLTPKEAMFSVFGLGITGRGIYCAIKAVRDNNQRLEEKAEN